MINFTKKYTYLFLISCSEPMKIHVVNYDSLKDYSESSFGPGTHYNFLVYKGENIAIDGLKLNWLRCENIMAHYKNLIHKDIGNEIHIQWDIIAGISGEKWNKIVQ